MGRDRARLTSTSSQREAHAERDKEPAGNP